MMIKISKWFDDNTIQEYKHEVVSAVEKKANTTDNITYINFGQKQYSINVSELLTWKLKDLRTKYKGLELYIYLCRLTLLMKKTKKEFLEHLIMWDPEVKVNNNIYTIQLGGINIDYDYTKDSRKGFPDLRKYVIKKIDTFDNDIYTFLINLYPDYNQNKDKFDDLLIYIRKSLSTCLFVSNASNTGSKKYEDQPYIIHYKMISPDMRHKLMLSLRISTCPYCNRQYITLYHDEGINKSTADLDHYYIKSYFPLFALSLFNFIPSCQICNSRFKGGKVSNTLYPYEEEFGSEIQFQLELDSKTPNKELQLKKWLGAINASNSKLKLFLTPIDDSQRDDFLLKAKGSKELFKLDEVYESHIGKAVEVVLKKRIYLEGSYQKYVGGFLKAKVGPTISLERFMLGYDWDNGNFDEPLSKMTYDIFDSTK